MENVLSHKITFLVIAVLCYLAIFNVSLKMHCSLAMKSFSVLLCSICFQHSLVYYANTTSTGNVFDWHVIDQCDCDSSKPGLNIRDSVNMCVLATVLSPVLGFSFTVQVQNLYPAIDVG